LNLFGNKFYSDYLDGPEVVKGTEMFWWIGVLITLLGATLTVVGFMVQKQSHSQATADNVDRAGAAPERPYYMEKKWLFGSMIWVLGQVICFMAMGLAPQSILASINCWNIVVTLVIAPWLLGEPISERTIGSASLLSLGTGWVVFNGPRAYQHHTVPLIMHSLSKPQSICAFAASLAFLVIMSALSYSRRNRTSQTLSYVQFTAISATFAWYATLLSKSIAKVMVSSVQLHQSFYNMPVFWGLVAALPLMGVLQVHFLNMGLKTGDAVMVIPMYEALSMTGQIVVGGLVFDEFLGFGPSQHAWFWPGVVIVMLGIVSLALEIRPSSPSPLGGKDDERLRLLPAKMQTQGQ